MWQQDLLKTPSVLTIISTIVNVILLLGLKTKYDEAKQANQATKEDIGDITKIVEDIKTNLSQETEILKAQLSYENHHKSTLKEAERQALLDYNKALFAWYHYMTRIDYGLYNWENFKALDDLLIEVNKRRYNFDLSESHLLIFVNNREFFESTGDVVAHILHFNYLMEHLVNELKRIFSHNAIKINAGIGDKYDIMKESITDSHKLILNSKDEMHEVSKTIITSSIQFKIELKQRLFIN